MSTFYCTRLIAPLLGIPFVSFGPSAAAQPWLGNTSVTNFGEGSNIRILTDGEGTWIAVWHSHAQSIEGVGPDDDIVLSRSLDNGVSWSPPAALNTNAATDSGDDRIPDLAFDGNGTWHAVWHSNDSLGSLIGDDFDVLIAHSFDAGASWTDPAPLNTNAASDDRDDYRPHVATDRKGHCVAVWGDDRIAVSRSADYGMTWTPPVTMNASTSRAIRGEVITDGLGNWMIVWYANWGNNDVDAFVARSVDNGASWSVPTALNINASVDDGNDFVPQVATDRQGTWVAVWHSFSTLGGTIGNDNDILFARSLDNGVTWTYPEPLNEAATYDGGDGDYEPHIVTDETGNWVVVWSSEALGNPFKILISRSTDGARTWTSPEVLYAAELPSYTPRLGTDRKGTWVAAWQDGLSYYGWYSEVLLSRFSIPLCDLSGDVDCDGAVTLLDLLAGHGCEGGPGTINLTTECSRLDFDKDGDLDMHDFAGFQRACRRP